VIPQYPRTAPPIVDSPPDSRITFEVKMSRGVDRRRPRGERVALTRWCCDCGRRGAWLEQSEVCGRNAGIHVEWHSGGGEL